MASLPQAPKSEPVVLIQDGRLFNIWPNIKLNIQDLLSQKIIGEVVQDPNMNPIKYIKEIFKTVPSLAIV